MDIDELLLLARSEGWADRVRAGEGLSAHVGQAKADAVLQELLLDAKDTAVIAGIADALLARGDLAAWRVFAAAWSLAGPAEADHLSGSLSGALFEASLDSSKAARLKGVLATLLTDDDQAIRDAARDLEARVTRALPE
ncbi:MULTISPECIES: hypothetical protein [unclassified Kribbella]|uniref:hypothetical protein n=1 Tax=unclassified Kribbella TaxID=2644121 RepID=UPI003017E126